MNTNFFGLKLFLKHQVMWAVALIGIACPIALKAQLSVSGLRCEYLIQPEGIDVRRPRLSWELASATNNHSQKGFMVMAGTDSTALATGIANLWRSGKVLSNRTSQVRYNGKKLTSRMLCFWKVKVWDEKNRGGQWSSIAKWSMGMLRPGDWLARWIGDAADTVTRRYPVYLHNGFRSDYSSKQNDIKWLVIDLGKRVSFDGLKLYPTHLIGHPADNYLFPLRFRIDVSNDRSFSKYMTIADETGADVVLKSSETWKVMPGTQHSRYVRLVVTKLGAAGKSSFGFTLAEFEVLSGGINRALKSTVYASGTNDQGEAGWQADRLTDGITLPTVIPERTPSIPSPMLRKEIVLSKRVKRAMLYASALGVYEVKVNGTKAGDHELSPEWTDYRRRVQYQAYDVTALLDSGNNVISATLADGWYVGPLFTHPNRGVYGLDRRFIAQVDIEFVDGGRCVIATDSTWKIQTDGPIRASSLYDGETYHATKNFAGWNKAGYDDSQWNNAVVDRSVKIALVAQMNEAVKVVREVLPVAVLLTKGGSSIFDFGQNLVGKCRVNIKGYRGQQIVFRHAEVLDDDGSLYMKNLRNALQTDSFVAPAQLTAVFEPVFTYHGFRYLEVIGLTSALPLTAVTACVLSSACPAAGTFNCSNTALNRLWKNILWTQRGNLVGVPTDCPQRDERLGWTGDAQVFSQTSIYNMDMASFDSKWMADLRDGQKPSGAIPDFAPALPTSDAFYNSPGWADAAIIIPWKLFVNYNDTEIIRRQYPAMRKYILNIEKNNPAHIWKRVTGYNYGDWLNGDDINSPDFPKAGGRLADDLYATAFFGYTTALITRMAQIVNNGEDEKHFKTLSRKIKRAFAASFINSDGTMTGNTQAGYALALAFNLVPQEMRAIVFGRLVKELRRYDNRMSTGIQSSVRLMNVLTEFGRNDLAMQLLTSHRLPSWLYSVDQGATTIWERWDGYVKGRGFQHPGMNSLNHYAFGAVGEWMFENILGLKQDENAPGYGHVTIRIPREIGIDSAQGLYHAICGTFAISWQKNVSGMTVRIQVPVNSTATVFIPISKPTLHPPVIGLKFVRYRDREAVYALGSGTYLFENY